MFGLSRVYAILGTLAFLSMAFVATDRMAYNRGKAACEAAQAAANGKTATEILKETSDAGLDSDNPDAVDCELRRASGEPVGDECGDL